MESRHGVLTGVHLLVAEDDVDAREILKSVLGYFGAVVTVAQGVDDAVRALGQIAPDAVIADMMLGRRDGLELLQEARRRRNFSPFIAVSGQDFDTHVLEGAGFAAYLRKPVDHNKLIDTILAVIPAR
jgi:DNA-binding response OmpR family regulator